MDISNLPQTSYDSLFGDIRAAFGVARETRGLALLAREDAPAQILDLLASGRLISDIAAHLDVPHLTLKPWLESHVDVTDLEAAARAGADALMFKAAAILELDKVTATEASQLRALSTHYTKMAERMDTETWGPPKTTTAAHNVTLNLGFGGGDTMRTIDARVEDAETVQEFDPSSLVARVMALDPDDIDDPIDADAEPAPAVPRALADLMGGLEVDVEP